jgi:hypothetical protein
LASSQCDLHGIRDLSGDWRLASATTNRTRGGAVGEQSTDTYRLDFSAFNCGRGCRILHNGTTLTIENAQLEDGATAPSLTVSIEIDGRPHRVVDSITLGNTIETVARWENGKLLITSMLSAVPLRQTISLEQDQLVVVKSFATSDTKITLRYTKK